MYQSQQMQLTASVFGKTNNQQGSDDHIYGFKIASDISWNTKVQTQLTYTYLYARADIRNQAYDTPYNLNYFLRAGLSYKLAPSWMLNATSLFRQGTVYQPIAHWQAIALITWLSQRLAAYQITRK